jgi:hypothetical protein
LEEQKSLGSLTYGLLLLLLEWLPWILLPLLLLLPSLLLSHLQLQVLGMQQQPGLLLLLLLQVAVWE